MDETTRPYRPVEIQLSSTTFSVAPGGSVLVPFAVINHTGRDDYFDIIVQGIPENWVLLDMPVLHLARGARREASLTVQAPQTSPISAGVYPVTLRAASQTYSEATGEAGFNLRVGAVTESTVHVAPFTSGGRAAVMLDTYQFTAAPGETLTVPVVVANQGVVPDLFNLTVEGVPPGWVTQTETAVRLEPGQQRQVEVYIQPPYSPTTRAGRHSFRVVVTSQIDPTQSAAADAVLTVAAVSQFAVDLNPRHMDAGRSARLRIHNLSNIQDTFHVQFQSAGDALEFVPAATGPVRVMPGETAVVDFAVSPRSPNWFGGPATMPYTVIIRSAEGEAQSQGGEVVSRSLIPVWVLPALLVLCLTALCGIGFLWNWNQGRLSNATLTAEARAVLLGTGTAGTGTALVNATTTNAAATAFAGQTVAAAGNEQTATAAAVIASTAQTARAAVRTARAARTATAGTASASTAVVNTAAARTALAETAAAKPTATTRPSLTPVPPTVTHSPTRTRTLTPVPAQPTATTTAPVATIIPLPVGGTQRFIFVSDRGGGAELYLFNSGSGALTALTSQGGTNTQPAWSPDGSKVAFTSSRDGNNEIYVMNADGSGQVNLTRNAADDNSPAWSPDGSKIAFTTNRDGNNEIYVMNADGSSPTNLTNSPASDSQPAWFTRGGLLGSTSRILFTTDRDGNNEIYAMNTDGSQPTNLTKSPANDSLPAVTFNGSAVAFVTDRDGNLEIYTMNVDGGSPTNRSKNPASDTEPAWSPDGKWIAFTTNRDGNNEIYIMAANGSQATNVTHSPADDREPTWH